MSNFVQFFYENAAQKMVNILQTAITFLFFRLIFSCLVQLLFKLFWVISALSYLCLQGHYILIVLKPVYYQGLDLLFSCTDVHYAAGGKCFFLPADSGLKPLGKKFSSAFIF